MAPRTLTDRRASASELDHELESISDPKLRASIAAASSSSSAERVQRIAHRGKRTQAQRAADAAEADRRWYATHRKELAQAGHDENDAIVPSTWRATWAATSDHSGRAARQELARFPAAIRGFAFYAIAGRSLRNPRARMIVACIALYWRQSRISRAAHCKRRVVERMPLTCVQAALHDFTSGRRPSLRSLRGKHRADGNARNGQAGYLDALREVGFMHWRQIIRCAPTPTLRPSCNIYSIHDPEAPIMSAAKRKLTLELELFGMMELPRVSSGLGARPPP